MATRRPHDGAFTPRHFPLDPFAENSNSREPWSLDASSLPDDDALSAQRNVLLVLGDPPLDAIAPLLHSPHLSSSLLILAASRAYSIPPDAVPAVRVLRLGVPITSSEAAASRLVAVLQWADRIACAWRTQQNPPPFQELAEDGATAGYMTPPNRMSWFGTSGSSSALPSPASSDLALTLTHTPPSSFSRSKRASTMGAPARLPAAPERNHAQRAFDALFDFLPPDAPDKQLLKHAILVTTVARQFLTCTAPSPVAPRKSPRRFSLRSRPAVSAPAPAAPTPAHLVHLIPPARSSLIRPLESFCLSFSFPSTSSRSTPALGLPPTPAGIDIGTPGPVPRPYVMPPAALADILHAQRKWSLAELVLCGALDREDDDMRDFGLGSDKGKGKAVSLRTLAKFNRAWLNGVGDLVLDGARPGQRERVMSDQPVSVSRRAAGPTPDSRAFPRPMTVVQPKLPELEQPSNTLPRRPASVLLKSHPSTSSSSHSHSSHSHSSHSHSHSPSSASASSSSHYGRHAAPSAPPRVSRMDSTASSHRTVQPVPPSRSASGPGRTTSQPWPTPPSSASSSPSSSPDLNVKAGNGVSLQDPGVQPRANGNGNATRLLTPPYDDKGSVSSSKGSGMFRKRKGLFAWMKR